MSEKAVIFDFDLTLVDSSKGICDTLNKVADEFGLRNVALEEVKTTIGLSLEESMEQFWGSFDTKWIEYYRRVFADSEYSGVIPFENTVETLEKLRDQGYGIGIATNRYQPEKIVSATGLLPYIDAMIGMESYPPKPNPAMLLHMMDRLGASTGSTIFVGDTDIDMQTAKAASVYAVGITTGNFTKDQLFSAGADEVISDILQLLDIVNHKKSGGL